MVTQPPADFRAPNASWGLWVINQS